MAPIAWVRRCSRTLARLFRNHIPPPGSNGLVNLLESINNSLPVTLTESVVLCLFRARLGNLAASEDSGERLAEVVHGAAPEHFC